MQLTPLANLTEQNDFWPFHIFTACIRSMTGRYCFHRCLSVNISVGVPHPGLDGGGGTPSQGFPILGVPHPGEGVPPFPWPGLDGGGYPIPGGTQGTSLMARSGWWGYPILGGVPHPGGQGGTPWPGLDGK